MGIHVACVGDSITQGMGASSPAAAYPSVLQSLLGAGYEVENDGRSGATLSKSGDFPYWNTVQFTASTAWAKSGGDVVIQLGTNDSKPANWSAAAFLADCKALVTHYRSGGGDPRVWISLPPPAFSGACCKISGTVIANEVVPALKTCAADTGVSTIDVHSALAPYAAWFPDGVHPNDQGAALIAQTIHDALVRTPSVSLEVNASANTAPVSVVLSATPTAAYGKVEKVVFFDNTSVVGEQMAAPWTLTLASVGEGKHVYRADVIETAGRTASSSSTAVTIEGAAVVVTPNVPPVVGSEQGGASSSGASSSGTSDETAASSMTPSGGAPSVAAPPADASGCRLAAGADAFGPTTMIILLAVAVQRLTRARSA
jgi:acyl-CoA thioesterase I